MPNSVEIGHVVLEKLIDRRTTGDRRSEKLTWAFGSGELKGGGVAVSPRKSKKNKCFIMSMYKISRHMQ